VICLCIFFASLVSSSFFRLLSCFWSVNEVYFRDYVQSWRLGVTYLEVRLVAPAPLPHSPTPCPALVISCRLRTVNSSLLVKRVCPMQPKFNGPFQYQPGTLLLEMKCFVLPCLVLSLEFLSSASSSRSSLLDYMLISHCNALNQQIQIRLLYGHTQSGSRSPRRTERSRLDYTGLGYCGVVCEAFHLHEGGILRLQASRAFRPRRLVLATGRLAT
jgi:hypothetical protein